MNINNWIKLLKARLARLTRWYVTIKFYIKKPYYYCAIVSIFIYCNCEKQININNWIKLQKARFKVD
jgi:hypothetical protein